MNFIEAPSPNFDERGRGIDMIVLHYTGMQTADDALQRMQDPAAKVSAHYMVDENGDTYRLVQEITRAWHAGVAFWKGDIDINARSIGIEIVNPGHEFGYRDFPDLQMDAVVTLLKDIRTRHDISPLRVVGHADVAPRRKEDPGEKFPWARLAGEGLAVAPYEGDGDASIPYNDALSALREIGYDANIGDYAAALLAFQRRYCTASLGQGFDARTKAALIYAANLTKA